MDSRPEIGLVTVASSPVVSTVSSSPSLLPAQSARLASVDLLRGLVMIIMALDHTRDFLTSVPTAPEDLAHTNGALFFTRFITHYCAPVFAFLAGTGAFLSTRRGKSLGQVSQFFLTRGLWLVFLEFTVVDFAWGFVPLGACGGDLGVRLEHGGDGGNRVAAGALDCSPGIDHDRHSQFARSHQSSLVRKVLLAVDTAALAGRIPLAAHFSFPVTYVLIPWVGVMATGFAFGMLLLRPDRRKWILTLGISATALFFVLRLFNSYGNGIAGLPFGHLRAAGPWSVQTTFSLSLISFFNTLKYPPSLDYLLMTLGRLLILLGLLDRVRGVDRLSQIVLVFGRVPLFYYILHLYLIHSLAILASVASLQPIWHGTVISEQAQRRFGYGHGLPFIYSMWILAVAILYLPCRWFMELRSRHRDWTWLSYL